MGGHVMKGARELGAWVGDHAKDTSSSSRGTRPSCFVTPPDPTPRHLQPPLAPLSPSGPQMHSLQWESRQQHCPVVNDKGAVERGTDCSGSLTWARGKVPPHVKMVGQPVGVGGLRSGLVCNARHSLRDELRDLVVDAGGSAVFLPCAFTGQRTRTLSTASPVFLLRGVRRPRCARAYQSCP